MGYSYTVKTSETVFEEIDNRLYFTKINVCYSDIIEIQLPNIIEDLEYHTVLQLSNNLLKEITIPAAWTWIELTNNPLLKIRFENSNFIRQLHIGNTLLTDIGKVNQFPRLEYLTVSSHHTQIINEFLGKTFLSINY
jgi:hypothetical protein